MAGGPDRLSGLQLWYRSGGATSDRGYGLDLGCSRQSATLRPAGRWSGFALAVGGWQLLLVGATDSNVQGCTGWRVFAPSASPNAPARRLGASLAAIALPEARGCAARE